MRFSPDAGRSFLASAAPLVLGAALVTGCSRAGPTNTAPVEAASITLVSGDAQTGTPGYLLDNPVTVRVLDDRGAPMVGVAVTFSPDDQHAYAESAADTTDADGLATTSWRLGAGLGVQHLRVEVSGKSLDGVNASANAASATVRSISGDYNAWCVVSNVGVLTCTVPPSLNQPNPPFPGTVIAPGTAFTQVVTRTGGSIGGCGVTEAGRIWCFDQGADGTTSNSAELPGSYPALHGLVATAVGGARNGMCALSGDGTGYCWGANTFGNLGVGDLLDRTAPTPVASAQHFASIVLDLANACGLTADGDAWCWGNNQYGQVGSAPGGNVLVPAQIPTTEHFRQLGFVGLNYAACGVRVVNGLVCWGGTAGLFGIGSTPSIGPTPVAIAGTNNVIGITSIRYLTSLIQTGGRVSLVGEVSTDIHVPTVSAAASDGFVLGWLEGNSRSFACGTARTGQGTLCQNAMSMAYDAAGRPVPGIVPAFSATVSQPAVIGVPVR